VRVIECNFCGETLSAANDEELVKTARRHMEEQHPEGAPDEARVRELVGEQAYDAMDS
jgi:predicted small metal-binding protein